MKFGKNKRESKGDTFNRKQQLRKKVWEDPSIIEDIFNDHDWQSYTEKGSENKVPSTKMQAAIEKDIREAGERENRQQRKQIYIRRFTRYVAAASILLLTTFNLWRWHTQKQAATVTRNVQHEKASMADSGWVMLVNRHARDSTITLPDQSNVKLFANSSLRYRENFTAHSRDIYLDGKAYFAVHKDASRPFSVYAKTTKTTALGTSFTIDTRANSTQTAIELHSGKVLVASTSKKPAFANVLLANKHEKLVFDADMRLVAHRGKKEADAKLAKSEKTIVKTGGRLQLDNIPLDDVFAALEQAYHHVITINDLGITKIMYTGVIEPEQEQLQDVLAVICLINDLRYEVNPDGSYTIYKQESNSTHKTQENL